MFVLSFYFPYILMISWGLYSVVGLWIRTGKLSVFLIFSVIFLLLLTSVIASYDRLILSMLYRIANIKSDVPLIFVMRQTMLDLVARAEFF